MSEILKIQIKKFNSALIQEVGRAFQPTNVEMYLSSKKSTFNFYTGQKKKKKANIKNGKFDQHKSRLKSKPEFTEMTT